MNPSPRLLLCVLLAPALLLPFALSSAASPVSRNVTLLANVHSYDSYSSGWAYVHPDGREYAVVGARTGLSIVRLTDPSNPVEVAFITGVTSRVREARQYRTWIYAVHDISPRGAGVGMEIISMEDPDHPQLVNIYSATFHYAHTLDIDTARGILYANSTSIRDPGFRQTGMRILSLADPVHPVEIGFYDRYSIHDLHTRGTLGFASAQEEGFMHILDLSDPARPREITSFPTPKRYTHSSWTTEDGRYLYITDENFADFFGFYGTISVWNIQNLNHISQTYQYRDQPTNIPHNPRIKGNRAYISHYAAGARVWDISRPDQPVELGFYDTWLGDDGIFAGLYEVTPFPSGIFIGVDINTGLYVFRPDDNYGIVRGIVRDSRNQPLADVAVRSLPDGPSTLTGPDGKFALAPSPGGVTLEAARFGYLTQTISISVARGAETTANFTVPIILTGVVRGFVRRASDSSPLLAADVSVLGSPLATRTDSTGVAGQGRYMFSGVPEGDVSVRAEYTGITPSIRNGQVVAKSPTTIDFSLVPLPFYDDAESDRGWTLGSPDDNATSGHWVRTTPVGTSSGSGWANPPQDHTPLGTQCFVTGNSDAAGDPFGEVADVDGGKTTLTSPTLDLSAIADPRIVYYRWFVFAVLVTGPPFGSYMTEEISNDGGSTWTLVSTLYRNRAFWEKAEIRVLDYFAAPGAVRVRFTAVEPPSTRTFDVLTEAAIDDFGYYSGSALNPSLAASTPALPQAASRGFSLRIRRAAHTHEAYEFELAIGKPSPVEAMLFDISGRPVGILHRGALPAGTHVFRWNGHTEEGERAAAGVYFLRVRANGEEKKLKVALVR